MKKYLKITLILFSICLVCALATAGVNLFTAPKIAEYQEEQKMAAYMELFEGMSASNSEFITEGFNSSYVKEKVIVKDETGNSLGYGMQVSGKNSYGTITLVVALDNEGNLKSIKCTENGQTGGRNTMINEYLTQFSSGMTATDVANQPVYSGATYGSNLVKNLLAAAFSEAGIMSPIQEKLVGIFGNSVDMGNTVEDTSFIYAQQITLGYEVKDGNNNVLGYYYEVNVTNRFGNINVGVALNKDYTLKQVNQIEVVQKPYGENDTTTIAKDFLNSMQAGSNYDAINGLATTAGATISTTSAKVAVLVAMKEAQNQFDEDLASRIMFYNYTTKVDAEGKLDNVDKYQTVKNGENNLGSVVCVKDSNKYGEIGLYVGITSSNTLAGIFITSNGQTAGRADSLSDYMNNFTSGMTGEEVISEDNYTGATFASNTVKDLLATAFEQVTGERPQLGYDSYYEKAFTGVDLSKSQAIEEFKSENISEGKILYDASGNVLGNAYVISGTNELDGTLTLMVAVKTDGKLQGVQDISNVQTGTASGLLDDYHNNFTAGMSQSDVEGVGTVSGATVGSIHYKSLVIECMAEVESYNSYYETLFGEVTFEVIKDVNRTNIIQAVTAKNGETVLGYAYIIRLENAYGYNVMCVALNSDGTYKKLIDVENNHADLTEISTVFEDGSDMTEIIAQGNSDQAIEIGASYTSEIATLGIKIAMDAYSNTLTESISDELYIKQLFNNAVMRKTNKITITNTAISKAYQVVGSANFLDDQVLGYVYFLTVENEDVLMSLIVGVSAEGNYIGSIMTNYETKGQTNISGSFADTLQGRVETYLNDLIGYNDSDIRVAPYFEAGSYASQLVKYALRLCIAESKNKVYAKPDLYSDNQIYIDALGDVDLTSATRLPEGENEFLYPETISGIKLADETQAYIVKGMDVYSRNYILVHIAKDGSLISIYDVENNHGSISGVLDFFDTGMTEEDVNKIDYNPTNDPQAHSSYTVEMTRLAILIAMQEFNSAASNTVNYELAVKDLYPFAIYTRGIDLLDRVVDTEIEFAMEVKGVSNYVAGQTLGYAFARNNVMVAMSTYGLYQGYVALGEISSEEKAFYDSVKANMTKQEILQLSGSEEAKNNIVAIINETFNFAKLTDYDENISQIYSNYSKADSVVLDIINSNDVLTSVNVKDSAGSDLGYAYVVYLTNIYGAGDGSLGYNRILVSLNANGTFNKVFDLGNNHSNVDSWTSSNPNVFVSGMTPEQITNIKYDAVAGASYTIETIKLAIMIAMNEHGQTNNSTYEAAARKVFPGMVAGRSEILTNLPEGIDFGYRIVGATGPFDKNSTSELGYFFVVSGKHKRGDLTLGIGIDTEGKLVGINIIVNGQTASWPQKIADYVASFTAGMTASDVANKDTVAGATLGTQLVKDLLAKAFNAYETLKGGNN